MTDDRTDEELVARLGQDPEALGALFDRYAGGLRAWLLRVTGDAALAEDLTAETFVVAWGAGRRFGAGAALAELPHDLRAALHLRVLQDLPYDQVAVELSCSVATARQRVSRALRHLTTSLEEAPPCPTS